MKPRPALALAPFVLGAVLVSPAGAGTAGADPCGDTDPMVRAGGVEQQPPGGRGSAFDIAAYGIEDDVVDDVVVGTTVVLELCGDVPGPELAGTHWSVSWRLDDRCSGGVSVGDAAVRPPAGPARVALLTKSCTDPGPTTPLGGASSTTSVVYSVEVPTGDWQVDGDRIVWHLRRGAALGEGSEQVLAGTVLARPSARARDGRQVTLFDVEGVRVTGPGTEDRASGAPDHRVG